MIMTKVLKRTEFGNPILRNVANRLTNEEIGSKEVKDLIRDMYYTLERKKYGVGLAAPQVGKSIALITISTKPTPTRPDIKHEKLTIINPEISHNYGNRKGMWEACVSGTKLYAKALRYKKVRLKWKDENAKIHQKEFDGFLAHVIQHEVDHLNGILFVDRVKDPKTFITFSEYKKLRIKENAKINPR